MGFEATFGSGGAPGWYGKISTLGDFASRRLPPSTLSALDHWLADVVAGSRAQLGDDWLDLYLAAPLQRFVLGPGLLDAAGGTTTMRAAGAAGRAVGWMGGRAEPAPTWWFGVLMPSCDNVGRYFPLVVLQPRSAPPVERFGLDHLERWWQRAGEAALATLQDDVDVERFDRALAELPPWPAMRESGPSGAARGVPAGECHVAAAGTLGELAQAFAAADWLARLQGRSLWWSWRPGDSAPGAVTTAAVPSSCRIVAGLPSAPVFAEMIRAAD
ncbi:MAG: type VI secretion system-associated protein TagF [Rubrivivax sp.]|nr:type VI secretion system-associated protein TagF [Rubrivivax sp.]